MQQVVQKELHKAVQVFTLLNDWELARKEIKKEKQAFAWSITYLNEWKHFCREFLLSLQYLVPCFSLISEFLSFKPLSINYMHSEIADGYFCWNATEKRSNQPGYVIGWIIFLQTDYFMVRWPRGLGTGFPIQASQV